MRKFKPSPEFKAKWKKFRGNRRAFVSLILLSTLFLFSLPAELIVNDKPLIMRLDGHWYFPAFKSYTWQALGGTEPMTIESYRGIAWQHFINSQNVDRYALARQLYGELGSDVTPQELEQSTLAAGKSDEPRKVSYVWAPLSRHSYKSSLEIPKVKRSRQALIPPWDFDSNVAEKSAEKEPGGRYDGFWLGTDNRGKDVFARLLYGYRLAVFFGLALTLVGYIIGTLLGAIQGFFGGWVDLVGQRLLEIWGSIPNLYILMILSSFMAARAELSSLKQGILLFGILSLTSWMGICTYMRAEFLRARNLEYVKAARALGQSDFKIMMRHILPNGLTPIITFLPFNISANMLALTSLDFLGLGLKYPAPSLGNLLSQAHEHLEARWILIPTFAVIFVTLMLLNFVGEGLRHAFDPRAT